MSFRLGAWDCPGCGRLILLQPLDEPGEPEADSAALATERTAELPPPPPITIDWQRGEVVAPPQFLHQRSVAATPAGPAGHSAAPSSADLLGLPGQSLPLPADGNTSGMGPGYPLPPQARGWTNASVIPGGLFSFYTGSSLWGAIGALGVLFGLPAVVYFVYVGLQGKAEAWRGRRFDSVEEYVAVMAAWNRAGLIIIYLSLGLMLIGGSVLIIVVQRSLAGLGLDSATY